MPRRATLGEFQDHLAMLLGCSRDQRPTVIANMLHRSPQESTGYWLQLLVAVGIATLGLVLGSTAVVIGAMLIAPLMGPIVSFGMGLAVGSPFLVVRSGVRILVSVILAIGSSSLLTMLLPFHELNAEIAARTTPTVLDLLTAGFCALAGVYASMRPGSEVASTAAGTSIGISLVPPLCASGYGVGVGEWTVAGGAALLFLTNFVAIVLVGTVAFAAAGFHQVDVAALEAGELHKGDHGPVVRSRLDERLRALFASRGGPWLRLLMPFLLLAAVYVPLREGLNEVAWQIGARKDVNAAIERLPSRVVQSRIRVERQRVELTLILVGSTADAEAARLQLEDEIRGATNVTPRLDVFAVADAKALAGLEAALRAPAMPAVLPERAPVLQLDRVRQLVHTAVERRWPSRAVGEPLAVSMTTGGDLLTLEVVHLGAALEPAAIEALERSLTEDLAHSVRVHDAHIPSVALAPAADDWSFIGRLTSWLENARKAERISVCLSSPLEAVEASQARPASPAIADAPSNAPLHRFLRGLVGAYPRVTLLPALESRVRFVLGACTAEEAPPPAPHAKPTVPGSSLGSPSVPEEPVNAGGAANRSSER